MPQTLDTRATAANSLAARADPNFSNDVGLLRPGAPLTLPAASAALQSLSWEPLLPDEDLSRACCFAMDGSVVHHRLDMYPPPHRPGDPPFSFGILRLAATPWPQALEAHLMESRKWDPRLRQAFSKLCSGAIFPLPRINLGFDLAPPAEAWRKAIQMFMERPWDRWKTETLGLSVDYDEKSPADLVWKINAALKCRNPKCLAPFPAKNRGAQADKAERSWSTSFSNAQFEHLRRCECGAVGWFSDLLGLDSNDSLDEDNNNKMLKAQELFEALFYCHVVDLATQTLLDKNNGLADFIRRSRGEPDNLSPAQQPLFIIKDGPFRMGPISPLAPALQAHLSNIMAEIDYTSQSTPDSPRVVLMGIEKTGVLCKHFASRGQDSTLKLHPNHFALLTNEYLSYFDGALTHRSERTFWGQSAVLSARGVRSILALPTPEIDLPFDQWPKNYQTNANWAMLSAKHLMQPCRNAECHYPLLALSQTATALPGFEHSMARFAMDRIMGAPSQGTALAKDPLDAETVPAQAEAPIPSLSDTTAPVQPTADGMPPRTTVRPLRP